MKVLFPERILERHVGGNTTYARAIADRLPAYGIKTGIIPAAKHPVATMVRETTFGLGAHSGQILHYSADTGALLPTRARSVVTVHGVASRWIDVARNPRQEWVWRTRVKRCIQSTTALITVSHSAADDVSEVFGVDRSDIHIIPHGIDFDAFAAPRQLSDGLAGKVPDRYVLYVGNIEPRKNIEALISAFESPAVRGYGIKLVIAGKPAWNFSSIMSRIESTGQVVYAGFVSDDDRAALMQNCLFFAFPSLYEGFGFPVLEAMAAGAPVLTSTRGSLAEVAGPARTVSDVSPSGIAEGIVAALDDAAWQRSAPDSGREWASTFSWDRSVDEHVAVYEEVINR